MGFRLIQIDLGFVWFSGNTGQDSILFTGPQSSIYPVAPDAVMTLQTPILSMSRGGNSNTILVKTVKKDIRI
jgi:hypothetical protein